MNATETAESGQDQVLSIEPSGRLESSAPVYLFKFPAADVENMREFRARLEEYGVKGLIVIGDVEIIRL